MKKKKDVSHNQTTKEDDRKNKVITPKLRASTFSQKVRQIDRQTDRLKFSK